MIMTETTGNRMGDRSGYPLRTLFWETTLRCNAYCEFCGSRCGTIASDEAESSYIRRALAELAEAYDPHMIMINVTGGEPLLRRDLFSVMEYAASLGFPWGMVTNGTLIDDDAVADMRRSGMKTISVSLDGMEKMHNAMRRLPDGFGKAVKAIRRLKEANFLDHIQVTTVVSRKNISELPKLYEFLLELEPDSWRVTPVDPIGRAKDKTADLCLGKKELRQYFDFMSAYQFNGKLKITASCSHYFGKFDNLYRENHFHCETGRHVASILANGDIYVCPNVPRIPALIQGNVRKDSLVDIWENGFQWFRDENRCMNEKCSRCEAWPRCGGDSLHTWDFDRRLPLFCFRDYFPEAVKAEKFEIPREMISLLKADGPMKGIRISYGSTSGRTIVFTPSAAGEFFHYFAWGKRHPRNRHELMAALAGHRSGDAAYVECLIPVFLEKRGEKEAWFSEQSYHKVLEEIAIMNTRRNDVDEIYQLFEEDFELLGFAHTHPNELTPALSRPDMELHQRLGEGMGDFQISLLLNPQTKELCSFWDSPYVPADLHMLINAEDGITESGYP